MQQIVQVEASFSGGESGRRVKFLDFGVEVFPEGNRTTVWRAGSRRRNQFGCACGLRDNRLPNAPSLT
jgi:hypothetical protein